MYSAYRRCHPLLFLCGALYPSLRRRTQCVAGERYDNPPQWEKISPNVVVINPTNVQEKLKVIEGLALQSSVPNPNNERGSHLENLFTTSGHFSNQRVALLFEPGEYKEDIPIGYYMQALGLGLHPSEVKFTGERGIFCSPADPQSIPQPPPPLIKAHLDSLLTEEKKNEYTQKVKEQLKIVRAGSLDTFWRAAENLQNDAPKGMLWAVSQASPIRRMIITKSLRLSDQGDYASGGFLSNLRVLGNTDFGSQQQFFARNSALNGYSGGAWSLTFVGVSGAPDQSTEKLKVNLVPETPIVAEKPFIVISNEGKYSLMVPPIKEKTSGCDFDTSHCQKIDFSKVFIAGESAPEAIQRELDSGTDYIVLSPGNYRLKEPIHLRRSHQVLLGLGMATLIAPSTGKSCLRVGPNLRNVRVGGIMFQAGKAMKAFPNSSIIEWGDEGDDHKKELSPSEVSGVLSDVFIRVGGPDVPEDRHEVGVETMVRIHSDGVIGDNVWLWRADHSFASDAESLAYKGFDPILGKDSFERYYLTKKEDFPCNTCLEVAGNHVYMYCLAAEHAMKDHVIWRGDFGHTFFYQSELPYHITTEDFKGHSSYVVTNEVTEHEGVGLGVYHFFRDHPDVVVERAITTPPHICLVNPFTKYLIGQGGYINHVHNDYGDRSNHGCRESSPPMFVSAEAYDNKK